MVKITNLENQDRSIIDQLGNFSVLEYERDPSVSPANATSEYFMGRMGVHKRQVIIDVDDNHPAVLQAGAMQVIVGDVNARTGIKGVGDFFGKAVRGKMTGESAIKPEYVGNGQLFLEPTYHHIILQDVADWPAGMVLEDGLFLACDGHVQHKMVARSNLSSATLGGEGLFNLSLQGRGVVALESNVPESELIEIVLNNDMVRIDGPYAVCWSASLDFTVERSSKTLLGSAVNKEGLVNVYRGSGRILACLTASTASLYAASIT